MIKQLILIFFICMTFWSCEGETREESIFGEWNLSEVCIFEDETCSGECSSEYIDSSGTYDVTKSWIEVEGNFQITFLDDGTGTSNNESDFKWSGSGPYTITTENDGDIILTLSNDMLTFTSVDDFCFQFTLTK